MALASSKELLDIQANYRVRFTLKLVRNMIITYSYSNLGLVTQVVHLFNLFFFSVLKLNSLFICFSVSIRLGSVLIFSFVFSFFFFWINGTDDGWRKIESSGIYWGTAFNPFYINNYFTIPTGKNCVFTNNGYLAASDLFHMLTQSIKFYK